MKINFTGIYKDVAKLVDAQAKAPPPTAQSGEFSSLLAGFSPEPRQPTVTLSEKVDPGIKLADQLGLGNDARAAFSFARPNLESPLLEPISPTIIDQPQVKESTVGVKKPSIIEIKRVRSGEAGPGFSQRFEEVKKLVSAAGSKLGLDPALSLAVVQSESSFDPGAVSTDGNRSKGLFQLLDSTGTDLMGRAGLKRGYDPFDPTLNVDLGVGYLRYLHDIFSQRTELPNKLNTVPAANSASLEKLAVAAFNAGEGRVASAQARAKQAGLSPDVYDNVERYLPESTQQYVGRVMALRTRFGDQFNS